MDSKTRRRLNFINVMRDKGFKYSDLKKDFGLDGNYLNRLANNEDKGMGDIMARRIEVAFKLPLHYLDRAIELIDSGRNAQYIPHLHMSEVVSYVKDMSRGGKDLVIPVKQELADCFFVEAIGESMAPKIASGDGLIVRPRELTELESGQVVLAKLVTLAQPIVRTYILEGGKEWLVTEDKRFQADEMKLGDEIIGVCVSIVRDI